MKHFLRKHGAGAVLLAGVSAVSVGAGMIYLPAGVITAGVLAILWWVLDSLDGGEAD